LTLGFARTSIGLNVLLKFCKTPCQENFKILTYEGTISSLMIPQEKIRALNNPIVSKDVNY